MAKNADAGSVTKIGLNSRRCPVCGKPADPRRPPFCSRRCADIDLGRWLKGGYRVETDERPGAGEGIADSDR